MISGLNKQLQHQLEYTLLKPDCHSWWISNMESGRDDTSEEWCAIKFCFKFGKNATKTYGMHQIVFWPSCMNRAPVFERLKEGRESVRDDERCVRGKEVRTPELIGQIKNFMDKDRRLSIEILGAEFDVRVGTVHTIIHEELKVRKICAKFVPRILREDQKERCCHDSREMVELTNSDSAVLDALVTCNESWICCNDPDTKRQSSQWKHAGSPRPKKVRQNKHTHKHSMILFLTALAWSTCTGFPLDRQSTWNNMLRFWGSSRRDSIERGQNSSDRVSGISIRTMHQSTTPSDYLSKIGILPIAQTLLSVTFGYSLSSRKTLEAVVMRHWGDERGSDEGHWHAHTRRLPWRLPEVVGTVQVHCSRRRLLRSGLELRVCSINISAHTKKV